MPYILGFTTATAFFVNPLFGLLMLVIDILYLVAKWYEMKYR